MQNVMGQVPRIVYGHLQLGTMQQLDVDRFHNWTQRLKRDVETYRQDNCLQLPRICRYRILGSNRHLYHTNYENDYARVGQT